MSASAGRVLLMPKGEYNAETTYHMLDMVSYLNASYVAKQTTVGNLPTDTTYWQVMTGSAGHIIEDETQTFAQRENLQFIGAKSVEDDETNDATVVNLTEAIPITQSDYNALSTAEKENGNVYFITDGGTLPDAVNVDYDNTDSGLTATNVQSAIDEIMPNGAGAHNAFYRGKYLGDSLTAEQSEAIRNGTFKGLYNGDYWYIDGFNYRIACFDYWLGTGDTECTTHHAVIVPDTALCTAQMNTTNTAEGGYVGSAMYTSNLATAKSTIESAFDSSHILTHRELLTNAITNKYPSAGSWYDSTVELMNEAMVYGSDFFTPHNSLGATIPHNYTIDKSQLPLFRFRHDLIGIRADWWLRDVVSSARFAVVGSDGLANYTTASYSLGVRPCFAIY